MIDSKKTFPDASQRKVIQRELDRNILVEAAAGTGKTTSIIERMIALLEKDRCRIDTLVAVTFTRKAAAELRARFQVVLEKKAGQVPEPARGRLKNALDHIEGCFIGTIHSFCARLLRERPVEAGVDVDFREISEEEDNLLRHQAWEGYLADLYAMGGSILDKIAELGLDISALREAYMKFVTYPDVDQWTVEKIDLPDLRPAAEELVRYAEHMNRILPTLPEDPGNDKLIQKYRFIVRMVRHADLDNTADLMDVLDMFMRSRNVKTVQKKWPGGGKQARSELERWQFFIGEYAEPMVRNWREYRYGPVLKAIKPAAQLYERLRLESGRLNYQDLLILAARFLRDRPSVRIYFRKRFTHILVDEFQDTDPIQAEIMFLITATDSLEKNWRRCRPSEGSLFVVGDPKQSIYRFRRADIVTYNQAREIIVSSGGLVVELSTNFRSHCEIVNWVNSVFKSNFPEDPSETSPAYIELMPGCEEINLPPSDAVLKLPIPEEYSRKDDILNYEAGLMARHIKKAIGSKETIKGNRGLTGDGADKVCPGDFLIITRNTSRLVDYSRMLQYYRIPHEVTGGTALNRVEELSLLHDCLTAVTQPDNPVALVAVLRGELFGVSDEALYRFKRAGGCFYYNTAVPEGIIDEDAASFEDAFCRLKKYSLWLSKFSPVVAIEMIAKDLGLFARACAGPGGNVKAGSLAKALEILRASQRNFWTAVDIVKYLGKLINEEEKHDGMTAKSHDTDSVRIMNLHKVKGLEAPVVFLADPSGNFQHDVDIHIDRSGGKAVGYLAVYGPSMNRGRGPLLACPKGWDEKAKKEREFLDAENIRLFYVAATRAGAKLIISQRAKRKKDNPWTFFEQYLVDCPSLADPGMLLPEAAEQRVATMEDASAAFEDVHERWKASSQPTYGLQAAKEYSLSRSKVEPVSPTGEHGTQWGSCIHILLETAIKRPEADLKSLAMAALADYGLDPALSDEALEIVRKVSKSALWKRANESSFRLVEVPFQTLVHESETEDGLPTIIRGVIDLVFRENEGWVIIDYKTSDRPGRSIDKLAALYGPQVRLYADVWRKMTGDPVKETGIYFIRSGRLVRV